MPGNALENPVAGGCISFSLITKRIGGGTQTVGGESCQSTPNKILQDEKFGIQLSELLLTCRLFLVVCHSGYLNELSKCTRPELTVGVISKNIRSISWEIFFLDESLENKRPVDKWEPMEGSK